MHVFKSAVLFLMILISYDTAFGRNSNSPIYADAGSWNTFNVSYSLNRKISLLFTEELRLKENYTRLNLFYTNLGVEYKFSKYLKTSLVYRWIHKYQDDNTFSFRHRLMWDVGTKYSYGKFSASYRHRLQVESRNIYSSETGKIPEWYSRNKFGAGYKINKKLDAGVAAEFRYQLHDIRSIESEHTWHRSRFEAGIDYQYSRKSKFGIYYLIQREYNVYAAENLYITGLEYSLSL